jgi:XTP/dITP diphosphohydrolase
MTERPRSVVVATTNPGKLREVSEVLADLGIAVRPLDPALPEPVEDAATFEENARIKARAYAAAMGEPCLADDSGLEVDALGGAPGVYSARYAGTGGTREERDRANNEKLQGELEGVPEHALQARFVCAMCLAAPNGAIIAEARGTFEGVITRTPRGTNGFGYDPMLVVPELGLTSAELGSEEKNRRSHRGQATRAIAAVLKSL